MKYVVVGQNRDTGARMSLEFEAESKGAAERKAARAGMDVHHVTEATAGPPATATSGGAAASAARPGRAATPAHGDFRPIRQSSGGLFKLIVLVAILAVVVWFFWGRIRGFLPR
jgi:hypothetical protein